MALLNDPASIDIQPASAADHALIWAMLEPVIRAGETYALPRDMAQDDALRFWLEGWCYVARIGGEVAGTYFLRANKPGGGAHVANCGYVTTEAAQGRGVASAMCRHSLDEARRFGFRAMQFNFVIASNTRAVALWKLMGFSEIGRIPEAFQHPRLGYVEALIMHRRL